VTITEFVRTSSSAATLHSSIIMKELGYHGAGRRAWEARARPTIQEPGGDPIARITTSRRGSKESRTHGSFPLPGNSPSSKLGVMSVTAIGDVRHGGSTEPQVTMQAIEG
jgi:hypothetical protein